MIQFVKEAVSSQFLASLEMLKNAMVAWPEEQWNTNKRMFYVVYHTLWFTDYYLSFPPEESPAFLPHTLVDYKDKAEEALDDIQPDRFYTREELLVWLEHCKNKCKSFVDGMTEETFASTWENEWKTLPVLEMMLYNMRHIQGHASQLNLMLRQNGNDVPDWVNDVKS